MEEQVTPVQEKKQRRSTAPLAILALLIILIALTTFIVMSGRSQSWDAASYLPEEVAVAVTVDVTNTADKAAARQFIESIFTDAGVKDPQAKMFKAISDELGFDVQKEALPKLNGKGGFAVLTEMNGFIPCMVGVVGTRSESDAQDLVGLIVKKVGENKLKAQKLTYEGFTYYKIEDSAPPANNMMFPTPKITNFVGAVKNAVVYANGDGSFKKVVDTVKGKPSLLKNAEYVRLRNANTRTFTTAYFSGANYYKLVGPLLSMGMGAMGADTTSLKEAMENAVAVVGTGEASAEGLKFSVKGISKKPSPEYADTNLDDLAASVPEKAAFAMSMRGWDKAWPEMKKELMNNPMFKQQIDQAVMQMKQGLQVDIFADVLDRITGITFYYVPKRQSDSTMFPGNLVLVLNVDKPDVVKKALDKINGTFSVMTGSTNTVSVAGQTSPIYPLDPNSGCYLAAVVVDKDLILNMGGIEMQGDLQAAVDICQNRATPLSKSEDYQLVKQYLPEQSMGLVYGNVGAAIDEFKQDIPASDRKAVEAVFKRVGVFGAASSANGTESEAVFMVPFKK